MEKKTKLEMQTNSISEQMNDYAKFRSEFA